jgi:hypothetical protein
VRQLSGRWALSARFRLTAPAAAQAPRNVVLIIADDLGRDLGVYGYPHVQPRRPGEKGRQPGSSGKTQSPRAPPLACVG